jgi:site-specific recombinase XerD
LGIDTGAIKEMLGHESIKTTEIYLDTLPNDIIDELHKRIIE